jgi:hypothetical protein
MRLNFIYTVEFECERIRRTLERWLWYQEQKYRINVPEEIRLAKEHGAEVTFEAIQAAALREFTTQAYQDAEYAILDEWNRYCKDFHKQLLTLGLPVSEEYSIYLTRYGVGGSYHLPNTVVANIDYGRNVTWLTVAHEITHLIIENLIQEYRVEHWTKERLVSLIINRFFPEHATLQRDPPRAEEIQQVFDIYFPDIHKTIKEVSQLPAIH